MALRICALFVVSALLFGCGGGDGGGKPAPGGGKPGAASPAQPAQAFPFPEKAFADIKGSLAADAKLTEQNVDSYVRYNKGMLELQQGGSADPMAMAAKMQNLSKDSGFKDDAEMKATMKRVAAGMHMLLVMAGTEASPAAGKLTDSHIKSVDGAKKLISEAGLSEADLRLIHSRIKDLLTIGAPRP
ncbi:MAG TPA: hypothetical protein PK280_21330 [Planctomycetota bacterium]|nr:hypothetical protein [Planctomycetota bacterium]